MTMIESQSGLRTTREVRATGRDATGALSEAGRRRLEQTAGGPFLINDWVRAVFIHYEVDPDALQPHVPYELDRRGGRAYVSLVAFVMRRLRPRIGGRVTRWLSAPVANHGFLNVRTYVKHRGEPGILFLTEWLPNRLSVFLGPRTFGLPYRLGRLDYAHNHERGELRGTVTDGGGRMIERDGGAACADLASADAPTLRYESHLPADTTFAPCRAGTLTEFLVERYTAYTERKGVRRMFRVWHEPWPLAPIDIDVRDAGLLGLSGPWWETARCVGAHYSPGVLDVAISRPMCINGAFTSDAWGNEVREWLH